MPAATPTSTDTGSPWIAGIDSVCTWKTGSCPFNSRATMSAVTAAMSVAVNTVGAKSRCTSSSTKTSPESGALNAAARPAPAPAAMSVWRSRAVQPNHLLTTCPSAPPIWMVGPSRPRASPLPMPATPPTNLTARMRSPRMRLQVMEDRLEMWDAASRGFRGEASHEPDGDGGPERSHEHRHRHAPSRVCVRMLDQVRPQLVRRREEARERDGREAAQKTEHDRAWKLPAALLVRAEEVAHLALDQLGVWRRPATANRALGCPSRVSAQPCRSSEPNRAAAGSLSVES